VLLNCPCFFDPREADTCPQPLYSGAVQTGLSGSWFVPATDRFHIWPPPEAGSCRAHLTPPYYTETAGCTFRQEVCGPSVTVTLPGTVAVSCSVTHAKRHTNERHQRRRR